MKRRVTPTETSAPQRPAASPVLHLLLWVLLAVVAFSPAAVGVLPARAGAAAGATVLAFSVYAFSFAASALRRKAALMCLSVCFAVTASDLLARRALLSFIENRPTELYSRYRRQQPLLPRFAPNVNFAGETYGDLAAMSMRREWREPRRTRFVTDAHGFRNDPHDPPGDGAYDLLLLGDSFGVAGLTPQEQTLSGLLARDYGLRVYNLSTDGAGPWQSYANLLLEGERLPMRGGAIVLWLIFDGNDLDDTYYPFFDKSQLPEQGTFAHLWGHFMRFRWRSPLRRALFGAEEETGPRRVVERRLPDGRRLLFYNKYESRRHRTAEEIRRHPHYESMRATFGAMKRLAEGKGLRVAVALVPSKEEVYAWVLDGGAHWSTEATRSGFSAVIEDVAREQGFAFVDLKPPLVGAARSSYEERGELFWWPDDTHWSAAGQRVAAEAIYRELLRPYISGTP